MNIKENIKRINDNIAEACQRTGRDPQEVRVIAVTKTVEVDAIRTLMELGHLDVGESRAQELTQRQAIIAESLSRRRELPGIMPNPPIRMPHWHMIGHLQRNKVRQLLPIVDYIHSVDSLRLAEDINTTAARLGFNDKVKIFLQVNTSQEKRKHGLAVGAVIAMAEQVVTLPNLRIVGLMTMAPLTEDKEISRFCFSRLRELFEEVKGEKIVGSYFEHLSMGMSQDYEVAVEEGATMVRLGTALFQ